MTQKPPANENKTPPQETGEDGYVVVMDSTPYQATREALYKNTFSKQEGTPWPTALLSNTGTEGLAQLRPLEADAQLAMPPEELEHWTNLMWRHREELSDLDADILDALSALWLDQASNPNDDAITEVKDLLTMRGLQPKTNSQGRAGGFRPKQRNAILNALWHIQNLWINVAQTEVDEGDYGRSRRSVQAIQSRAFIITDRMGQLKLDGSMDVERFIFRPGKVFAHFLFGPGRQTALLAAKALRYDPYRNRWEKRLARYLSWQWRAQTHNENYLSTYTPEMLLDAVGENFNERYPARTRKRLERTLKTLHKDHIIGSWQYESWDEGSTAQAGWPQLWLEATLLIEPPSIVKDYYQRLERHHNATQNTKADADADKPLSERIKLHRKRLGLSQQQASDQIGISQSYFSRLERGRIQADSLSRPLINELEDWLSIPT